MASCRRLTRSIIFLALSETKGRATGGMLWDADILGATMVSPRGELELDMVDGYAED